jgi:dTDP-4-dehydrorhamnose reductase
MLIIGGNSTIGKTLRESQDSAKYTVRGETKNPLQRYLDLSNPKSFKSIEDIHSQSIIFCTGITDTKMCQNEWQKTFMKL